jgi:hypothetical protein
MTGLLPEKVIDGNTHILSITNNDITINRQEINYALGYKNNPLDGINDLIDDVLNNITDMYDFCAAYRILPLAVNKKDSILVDNTFLKTNKIITNQLKDSEQAALFVCTIGPEPEKWSKKLMNEGDPALSFIIDSIASVTVENTALLLHNHIEESLSKKGLKVTNRFSPGYCGWNVEEQHKLFRLLPDNICGISLSESAFMIPRKSVSGLIGIGSGVKRADYPCKRCPDTHCIYRQKKEI